MRRKVLQDFANTCCQMLIGWRLFIADDVQRFTALDHGLLTIDLLTAQCQHDGRAIPSLAIAQELHAWLGERLAAHTIPVAAIERAEVVMTFQITVTEKRRSRVFQIAYACHSEITTASASYHGGLGADDPGVVRLVMLQKAAKRPRTAAE